jgi:transcriptional regulator with XRE-family HTH domain
MAARTARILEAGLIADAESVAVEDGVILARCPAWGGSMAAEIYFSDAEAIGFVTVGVRGPCADKERGSPGEVEYMEVATEAPVGIRLLSSTRLPAEQMKLSEASVVVAGGAGVGSAEGFGQVRELAAALGGEVGATRPAVLSHWAGEDHLIGQTGQTVRPRLLLTIGTSGALQYTAGISEAETIVAINRDSHAPIFDLADLGLVADARTLLPVLIDKVRKARLRRLADALVPGPAANRPEAAPEFGAMMRALRESHGFTLESLAQATGQDPDFLARVEAGEVTPSVSFLLRLAKAVGVDPSAFLTREEKTALRDERSRAFITRTQNYSYQTLTPGAENQHLRGFMIVIEPRQVHKPVAYKHEGEEFVFVLEGELELTVGSKVWELKPGESRHFNSDVPHKLRSLSDFPTRCLVMLYTP